MDFENFDYDLQFGNYSNIKIIKFIFLRYLFFLYVDLCIVLELQILNFVIMIIFNFNFFRGFLKSDKLIGIVNVKL